MVYNDLFDPKKYFAQLRKFMNKIRRQGGGFEQACEFAVMSNFTTAVSQLERIKLRGKKSKPLNKMEIDEQTRHCVKALCIDFGLAILERLCKKEAQS